MYTQIPYPLCVLVGSDEEMDNPGQGTMFPQWSMVCRTEGQISDETHNSLDEGPSAWWVK